MNAERGDVGDPAFDGFPGRPGREGQKGSPGDYGDNGPQGYPGLPGFSAPVSTQIFLFPLISNFCVANLTLLYVHDILISIWVLLFRIGSFLFPILLICHANGTMTNKKLQINIMTKKAACCCFYHCAILFYYGGRAI